jgi:hypothetical protein
MFFAELYGEIDGPIALVDDDALFLALFDVDIYEEDGKIEVLLAFALPIAVFLEGDFGEGVGEWGLELEIVLDLH